MSFIPTATKDPNLNSMFSALNKELGKLDTTYASSTHTHDHVSLTNITADQHHAQVHDLAGANHTVSGLTPGHFLKALSATTFGFAAHGLTYSDVGALASGGTAVDSDKLDGSHASAFLGATATAVDSDKWDGYQFADYLNQAVKTTSGPTFSYVNLGANNVYTTSRAKAYLGTSQLNIADVTWTKVLLDTEVYDSGGNFASNRFVAPVAGYYQINASVLWNNVVAGGQYVVGVFTDGSATNYAYYPAGAAAAYFSTPFTDTYYLTYGQYIELYVFHSSGVGTEDILSGSFTFMAVHILSVA